MLRNIRYLLVLSLIVGCSTPASAQVTWLKSFDNSGGLLEFRHKSNGHYSTLEDGYYDRTNASVVLIHGYARIFPNLLCLFQFPISHTSSAYFYDDYKNKISGTVIGNPCFGFEWARQNRSSGILQAGMRLRGTSPQKDQEYLTAYAGAQITIDQYEAFLPGMFTAQVAGGYQFMKLNDKSVGVVWKSVLGGTYMKQDDFDGDFFVDLNSELWLRARHVRVGVGGTLRVAVTQEYREFWNRFTVISGMSVIGTLGVFRPQAGIRMPLTNYIRQVINFTYALGLGVDFGGKK